MKKLIVVSLYIFLLVTPAFPQFLNGGSSQYFESFWDFYSVNYLSSKAAGKGYAGVAADNDLSGTILNPASLEMQSQFQIYGEYVYKSNMGISPYSGLELKEHHPTMLGGIGFKISKNFSVGALYENNKGFKLEFESTDEFGNLTGNYLTQDISISSVVVPFVYNYDDILKLGVNFKYSFYSSSFNAAPDFDYSSNESFQKFIPDFGVIYKPIKNLSIGAMFTPQTEEYVEGTYTDSSMTNNYTYTDPNYFPWKFGIGLEYTFEKTPLTLSADYNYENTSIEENLKDRNNFNFGMEYIFNKKVTIRGGLFTSKDGRKFSDDLYNYYDPGSYSQMFATLGGTVNIEKVNLNLAVVNSSLLSTGRVDQTQVNFGIGYDF